MCVCVSFFIFCTLFSFVWDFVFQHILYIYIYILCVCVCVFNVLNVTIASFVLCSLVPLWARAACTKALVCLFITLEELISLSLSLSLCVCVRACVRVCVCVCVCVCVVFEC